MDNRFPASRRLKKESDIKAVFAKRESRRGQRLIFYRARRALETGQIENDPGCRVAIMVSRRCGSAPRRNRIKRIIREIIRHRWEMLPSGYDFIIRVDPDKLPSDKLKQEDFLDDFEILFRWS